MGRTTLARQAAHEGRGPVEPCWIHTPDGVFWSQDPACFQRKLEHPFVLIPMQLFDLGQGFVVGDATREVLPVALHCITTGQVCFVYSAYDTTAQEICQLIFGPHPGAH